MWPFKRKKPAGDDIIARLTRMTESKELQWASKPRGLHDGVFVASTAETTLVISEIVGLDYHDKLVVDAGPGLQATHSENDFYTECGPLRTLYRAVLAQVEGRLMEKLG